MTGKAWKVHKNLMDVMSPILDCGVHYVDMMCQMTQANPVQVHAIGAKLHEDLKPGMYNYGQLQVVFDEDTVGWYVSGWGPMMSESAYFIKDAIGPKGSISVEKNTFGQPRGKSATIDDHGIVNKFHGIVNRLWLHHADTDKNDHLTKKMRLLK